MTNPNERIELDAAGLEARITQAYLRRYPNSKPARSWAGVMVHIETEHGIWRENAQGYTYAGMQDAWVLTFEDAVKRVSHCGPEKRAAFIRATSATPQPQGLGEPVAWRGDGHDDTRKFTAIKRVAEIWAEQGLVVTPLYPASTLAAIAAERDALRVEASTLIAELATAAKLAASEVAHAERAEAALLEIDEALPKPTLPISHQIKGIIADYRITKENDNGR